MHVNQLVETWKAKPEPCDLGWQPPTASLHLNGLHEGFHHNLQCTCHHVISPINMTLHSCNAIFSSFFARIEFPYPTMNIKENHHIEDDEEQEEGPSDLELSEGHEEHSSATVPLLLNPAYTRTKSLVYDELRNFRISLKWCALDHSSTSGKAISFAVFLLFTLLIPAVTSLSIHSSSSSSSSLNKLVQLPESILTIISFVTLSSFFRRYGLRQLLFLDDLYHDSPYVRHGYTRELDRSFKYWAYILLPSFSVELAHKIVFFSTVTVPSIPFIDNSAVFIATLASWVYRTGVFLLVCVLFQLTCELQILRFQGLYKMFEGDGGDAGDIFKEHLRIKKQLFATSHRYRIFIIACFVTITISQLGALLLVLASKFRINFSNYVPQFS